MKLLRTACQALILVVCTATLAPTSAEAVPSDRGYSKSQLKKTKQDYVMRKTEFVEDEHIGVKMATAPEIRFKAPERNVWTDSYIFYELIAVDVGRSGPDVTDYTDVLIRMKQSIIGDWAHYGSAFSLGQSLDFKKIDSHVDCSTGTCYHQEIFGVDMTIDQLRDIAQRPSFSFKIVGQGKSAVVQIPQSYVTGFLAAIDERMAATN